VACLRRWEREAARERRRGGERAKGTAHLRLGFLRRCRRRLLPDLAAGGLDPATGERDAMGGDEREREVALLVVLAATGDREAIDGGGERERERRRKREVEGRR
jgi:hypothetical protein